MNLDEQLQEVLTETIFWHDIAHQLLSRDPKDESYKKRLEQSYPSVLYEASFLTGNRNWYDQALERDHSLSAEEKSSITTIKVEKNKENRNIVCISEPTQIVKKTEYVSWQCWRSTGFNNEHYPHLEFPTFFERVLVYINDGVGRLRANKNLPIGETAEIKYTIDGSQRSVPYLILEKRELPDVCGHRYEYELLFDQFVPEDVAEQIMGVSYIGHR